MVIEAAGDVLPAVAKVVGGATFVPYFASFLPDMIKRLVSCNITSDICYWLLWCFIFTWFIFRNMHQALLRSRFLLVVLLRHCKHVVVREKHSLLTCIPSSFIMWKMKTRRSAVTACLVWVSWWQMVERTCMRILLLALCFFVWW